MRIQHCLYNCRWNLAISYGWKPHDIDEDHDTSEARFLQPSIRLRYNYYVQLVATKRDWMRVPNFKIWSPRQRGGGKLVVHITVAFPYNIGNIANLSIYKFMRPSGRPTASVFINVFFIKRARDYRSPCHLAHGATSRTPKHQNIKIFKLPQLNQNGVNWGGDCRFKVARTSKYHGDCKKAWV